MHFLITFFIVSNNNQDFKMKAIQFHKFGESDVLIGEEAPKPTIGTNDVLIEMKAAALNHLDLWVRNGSREKNIPLPHIPGSDGSGIIAEIGNSNSHLKIGDKVLISPGISCGQCEYCLGGLDNLCRYYHVFGTQENGTYAKYVKIPQVNVVPIPGGLDFVQAAAIPLVFLTAWHMLVTLTKIKAGETVLIHGAGSGVGSAAIQIAKMIGAHVITTAGTDWKLKRAKEMDVDETINYSELDFVEEVKRITGKRGVDIVFEHTGGEVFEKSITVLTKGGRLVTCGATTAYSANIDLRFVYAKHLTIYGSFMGTKQELIELLKFFKSGVGNRKLIPIIDTILPLEKASEAHQRMEARMNFGKIVLTT
jgi:NADPH:quinone reductase-like Zn-dependent oxidoreductase